MLSPPTAGLLIAPFQTSADLRWQSLNTITPPFKKECVWVWVSVGVYIDRIIHNNIAANEINHYRPPKKNHTPNLVFYRSEPKHSIEI